MNNLINKTGYLDGTSTSKNPLNIIPGRHITMKGVSQPLTLIPIIGGKPRYDKKVTANPGDDDFEFGTGVEGVLELPMAANGMVMAPLPVPNFYNLPTPLEQYNISSNNTNLPPYPTAPKPSIPTLPDSGPKKVEYTMEDGTKSWYYEGSPDAEQLSRLNNNSLLANNTAFQTIEDPQKVETTVKSIENRNNTPEEQQSKTFTGAINPYGGWNMANTSTALGAFVGMKINPNDPYANRKRTGKTLGIIGSAGKLLLAGARNAFSGAAAMNVYQDSLEEQAANQKTANQKATQYFVQEGGRIPNKEGKLLTGNYIYGNDEHPNPNAEVEQGEYIQTPDGSTMEVVGKKHSEGGEMLDLPQSTIVVSDHLKIGGKLSTYFKKNYGLNVTAKSTFSTVIDRFKRKIGLTKLLDEETKLMQKIADQEKVEFEPTREINLQVLSEKVTDLQSEKQPLEERLEEFTRVVFDRQEEQKDPNDTTMPEKQEGGEITDQQSPQPPQEPSSQIEQLILMFSQITGANPEEVIQQLQQLPDDQLQQALQEIVQVVQQASQEQQSVQENPQTEKTMQSGGKIVTETTKPLSILDVLGITPEKTDDESLRKKYENYDLYNLSKVINTPVSDNTPDSIKNRIKIAQELYDNHYGGERGRQDYMYGTYDQNTVDKMYDQYTNLSDSQALSLFKTFGKHKGAFYTQQLDALGKLLDERHINPITGQGIQLPQGVKINSLQNQDYTPDEIKDFQRTLIAKGYDVGATKDDGIIGKNTLKALEAYRTDNPDEYNQTIGYKFKDGGKVPKYQYGGANTIDDGFVNTTATFTDWKDYDPVVIQLGKSMLGAQDVVGEVYNPGSQANVDAFMQDAQSLLLVNPNYEKKLSKLVTDINNAKTDEERFNILNTRGQRERQEAFLEVAPDDLKGYVGMGYAPTQSQLQEIYNGLSTKTEKDKFTKVLKENNWAITNTGLVQGGNFKYNTNYKPGNTLFNFVDGLQKTNPKLYNKVAITNINDGVYDRRRENFRVMSFKSVSDRDEAYKKHGFVTKGGFWVDPNNRNNIVIPKVYRDKEVTQKEYDEWKKRKDADIDGYKVTDDPNIFVKYTVKGSTPSEGDTKKEDKEIDSTSDITKYQNKQTNFGNVLPMAVPDQSNLPPNYIPSSMREVKHVQANTINVSPEATLGELANQTRTAANMLVETNPYTSAAGVSTLQANQANAANQAWAQAEMANQQDERNVANINEERIQRRDATNLELAAKYEREAIGGADNLYSEWRNFITNRNQQNLVNYNLQNQVNAFNAINSNYQIGPLGAITQTQEKPFFHYKDPSTGKNYAVDTTTKERYEIIERSPDGRTRTRKTTTTERKNGGFIGTDNLSQFLKTINK